MSRSPLLPKFYYRRAWLRAFWVVISASFGVIAALLLAASGAPGALGYGFGLMVGLALPGLLRPSLVTLPYRAFRAGQWRFHAAGRTYVSALCYYLVVLPVAQTGAGTNTRGWIRRTLPSDGPDGSQHRESTRGDRRPFLAWSDASGQPWTLALVPFLTLLALLHDSESEVDIPTDTYTLY